MALSGEEIVKEDKLCLLKLVNGQLVSAEPSSKGLFYFIVTVNDQRQKKLYGTVGPDDTRVTYSYDEIGLPDTPSDNWSAERCVMRLGIAKNVLKAHSGTASSAPKWSPPPGHLNRGYMPARTPNENDWFFPDRVSTVPETA